MKWMLNSPQNPLIQDELRSGRDRTKSKYSVVANKAILGLYHVRRHERADYPGATALSRGWSATSIWRRPLPTSPGPPRPGQSTAVACCPSSSRRALSGMRACCWKNSLMAASTSHSPACACPAGRTLSTTTAEKELYDLTADPFQLTNLANRPEHAAMQDTLEAKMRALLTGDPRPTASYIDSPPGCLAPSPARSGRGQATGRESRSFPTNVSPGCQTPTSGRAFATALLLYML